MNRQNGPLSLLIIAYFAFVVIGMPGGVLNIAWTYMQPTFEVELDALGILLGFGTVGYLLTSFTNGRIIARLGLAPALLTGTLIGALGMAGYMLAPSWPTLLILALVGALGSGVIDAGLNTFVSVHYSTGRLNWLHAAFGVGATIGPLVATFTITRLDQSWRVSYAVGLVLFLLAALCFFLTRRQWTLAPAEQAGTDGASASPAANAAVSFIETLRVPLVPCLVMLFFLYSGAEVSAAQLTNTLFIDGRGISQETAGFWIGLYWLSFTVGRVLIGFIADRVSHLVIVRGGLVASIVGGLMLSANAHATLSFLGLALVGFGLAPIFATLIAETPRRVGLRHAANTIGFQVGMAGVGISVLPGLGGLLAERVDLEIIGPFVTVLPLAMIVLHEYVVFRERRNARVGAWVPAAQD